MHTKLNQFTSTHLSSSINLISVSCGSTALWFFSSHLWGAQILKRRFCDSEVMDRKITILSANITKPSLILLTLVSTQAVRPSSIDAFFSLSSAEEDSNWRQIMRFFIFKGQIDKCWVFTHTLNARMVLLFNRITFKGFQLPHYGMYTNHWFCSLMTRWLQSLQLYTASWIACT